MRIFLAIVFLILVGFGAYWWVTLSSNPAGSGASATSTQLYTNAQYGIAFSYPNGIAVHEYTPTSIAVGTPGENGGFNSAVNIEIKTSDSVASADSYEAFVANAAELYCAADGPSESYSCPSVASTTPITTTTGLSGEALFLNLKHTTGTGSAASSTMSAFGPVYAFNIGANVPGSKYAAVLIFEPLTAFLQSPDPGASTAIAETLQINKVGQ